MNEQQIEVMILEIKKLYNLAEVTFSGEVSGKQYFEARETDGIIRQLQFSYGKIYVKIDGEWIRDREIFIKL